LSILDEARRLVIGETKRGRCEGGKVLRVFHGYSSSGKGGTLCVGLRKSLSARRAAATRTRRSRAIVTLAVGRSLIWRYSVMKPAASHTRSLSR